MLKFIGFQAPAWNLLVGETLLHTKPEFGNASKIISPYNGIEIPKHQGIYIHSSAQRAAIRQPRATPWGNRK